MGASNEKKPRSFTIGDFVPAIIFLILCGVGAFFCNEESVWDRRLKSGYHYMEASDDLGTSEWRHADENGSEVVVWKVEASENTSERWIVVGFGTNSIMYSYDIVYDQDHVDRIIKEKY
jgi:hypothetical protein